MGLGLSGRGGGVRVKKLFGVRVEGCKGSEPAELCFPFRARSSDLPQ